MMHGNREAKGRKREEREDGVHSLDVKFSIVWTYFKVEGQVKFKRKSLWLKIENLKKKKNRMWYMNNDLVASIPLCLFQHVYFIKCHFFHCCSSHYYLSCAESMKLLPPQQSICFPALASQIWKCLMWLLCCNKWQLTGNIDHVHHRAYVKERDRKTDYNHFDSFWGWHFDFWLILLREKKTFAQTQRSTHIHRHSLFLKHTNAQTFMNIMSLAGDFQFVAVKKSHFKITLAFDTVDCIQTVCLCMVCVCVCV